MEHETKAPSSEPVAGLVERTVRHGSEALRLAEWIESDMTCQGDSEIAAELRRQHAEIERLRGIVPEVLERLNNDLCAENERLRAALSAILERVNQPSFGMGRDIRAMTEAALGPNAELTGSQQR